MSSVSHFLKYLKCPITGKIFFNPIVAPDGKIYEEIPYMEKNGYSKCVKVHQLSNLIDMIISKNPKLKQGQFNIKNSQYNNIFIYNKQKVLNKLMDKKYEVILDYNNFSLEIIGHEFYAKILEECDQEVSKHLIDNTIDIDFKSSNDGWSFINYVTANNSSKILKMLIDTNRFDVNMACPNDEWTIVHQLIHYNQHDDETRKYMLNKVDLYKKTTGGETIVDFVFAKGSIELIQFIMNKIEILTSDDVSKYMDLFEINRKVDKKDGMCDTIISCIISKCQ